MLLAETPMGGSEIQFMNVEHLVPHSINLMLNTFKIDSSKINIHWQHQYFDQPSVVPIQDKRIQQAIDIFIFVSYHQKNLFEIYHKVPQERAIVLKNAIWPIEYKQKPRDRIRLIYTSTPFRGLDVLVNSFYELLLRRPEIRNVAHLDIFSSMSLYGKNYQHLDVDYQDIYDLCKRLNNITYHGVVSEKELRTHLQNAHIFAYPNTWHETSCISALQAMSAGCVPVISNIGALPETCGDFAHYYSPISTSTYNKHLFKEHVMQYSYVLENAITKYLNNPPIDTIEDMMNHVNKYYSWEYRLPEWKHLFQEIEKQSVGY